jgi:transketolase
VILGDGELDEGSVWETCLVAAAQRLDHLIAIVDRNKFQANLATEELTPLEPLAEKFAAFGWNTMRVDGHDFAQLDRAFAAMPSGKPYVVIADTVRNKGLPSIEGRADRWFVKLTPPEVEALLAELHGAAPTTLTSMPQVVR